MMKKPKPNKKPQNTVLEVIFWIVQPHAVLSQSRWAWNEALQCLEPGNQRKEIALFFS